MYEYFIDVIEGVGGEQSKALCPFHNDEHPSFTIDGDGRWYCFACGKGAGPVTFLQRFLGVNKSIAQYICDFYAEHDTIPLPKRDSVERYHKTLMNEPELLNYFSQLGVKEDILEEFKIGWDIQSRRIIFPIPSKLREDIFINLRKYAPPGSPDRSNKLMNEARLGSPVYYPYKAFDKDVIYVVEGEKDMIVGRSNGLNTVTSTGGTTIPTTDIDLFNNKKVYIITDSDDAGDNLANKYYKTLKHNAKEVIRIRLPEKDLTDAFVANPDIDIYDYIKPFETKDVVEVITIGEMMHPSNTDKEFKVKNIRIIGEDMTSYQLPIEVTMSNGQQISIEPRELLSYIGSRDHIMNDRILSGFDDDVTITDRKDALAQMVYFRPDINMYEDDAIHDTSNNNTAGMYINDTGETIKTNRVYDMNMIRTIHPNTQENIFIITEAKEAIMDNTVDINDLEYFRSERPLEELMEEYYHTWAPHLEVNGRQDLFEVMILTYLSVLEFKWRNSTIKGRLDSIVVGDTRTGKTKMIRNFMNTVRIGEYVSGENARATGIIGGINQIKNTWTLNWGKIPINDKRLVIIDEASGLSISDITDLSQMRSEGILSITKIKQESTYARTRLLWITNPRSGERINEHFWNGYDALKEFMPVQEDMARFDIAVSAAIEDVDNIFEYANDHLMEEHEIDRWRSLILFAWALTADQIVITKEAQQELMDKSIKLGRRYNEEPLFMSVNGYEKLARIAIAAAVLTFNYDTEEEILQVESRHVIYAVDLLLKLYSKKSFGLADKADVGKQSAQITAESLEQLKNLEIIYDNLDNLFRDGSIPVNLVPTVLGVDREGADNLISQLYNLNLVDIGNEAYTIKPTPMYLEHIRNKRMEKM